MQGCSILVWLVHCGWELQISTHGIRGLGINSRKRRWCWCYSFQLFRSRFLNSSKLNSKGISITLITVWSWYLILAKCVCLMLAAREPLWRVRWRALVSIRILQIVLTLQSITNNRNTLIFSSWYGFTMSTNQLYLFWISQIQNFVGFNKFAICWVFQILNLIRFRKLYLQFRFSKSIQALKHKDFNFFGPPKIS